MNVDSAPLPARPDHDGADGVHQAAAVVGDHQLRSTQATLAQTALELGPEVLGLAVPDGAAEDLSAPVGADARGDHDGLRVKM